MKGSIYALSELASQWPNRESSHSFGGTGAAKTRCGPKGVGTVRNFRIPDHLLKLPLAPLLVVTFDP